MKWRPNNVLENKWWQEVAVLLFSFSLFYLKNDRFLLESSTTIITGVAYYFLLYIHAQLNRFFLLPILLKANKGSTYLLLTAILGLSASWIIHELSFVFHDQVSLLFKYPHQRTYLYQLASVFGTLVCILSPVMFLRYYGHQKKKNEEALLLNQMQMNALKSQLNPHFLFNTFNTLYGISLEFPTRTPDLIMKMSNLMRYQLESNSKHYVALEDELSFIDSYIQLEKERVGYRCDIHLNLKVDKQESYNIPPMLLIAFVENAFKHGACGIENCFVHIDISINHGTFRMEINNSIPKPNSGVVSTKIGIKNAIERLNLVYGKDYQLNIDDQGKVFKICLTLVLTKGYEFE